MERDLNWHFSKDDIPKPTLTWKDAQYNPSSGKCKSKPQWGITSHLLEGNYYHHKDKKKKPSLGKDVEERELWYTVGGNVNLYSYYGKQYGGPSKS